MSDTLPPHCAALLEFGGPPELGPGPRPGVLTAAELTPRLDQFTHELQLTKFPAHLVRAVVLLWHDQLDAAHELAQALETPDGSLVHGIVHRREPDYANSIYWFRRAGNHRAFPKIAAALQPVLPALQQLQLDWQLLPGGHWDPFAFTDLVARAARLPSDDALVQTLRQVQAVEFRVLLEVFLRLES